MRPAAAHAARAACLIVIASSWPLNGHRQASGAEPPSCSPDGTALAISAKDNEFDKECLAAPAGETFTIAFDNQDAAVPHNVAIYLEERGGKAIYKGEIIFGPRKIVYAVPAQAAGTYVFRCDPHDDTMIGQFVVGNGETTDTTGPSQS